MKKIGLFTVLLGSVASMYFVVFHFQNCAKVNYQTQNGVTVTAVPNSITDKVVEINPEFFTDQADVKVLLVVDDSYTMSQSQSQLANAMDSLLDPLRGRDSEIRIVSTTGVLNNQIDYFFEDESGTSNSQTYGVKRNYKPSDSLRHSSFKISKALTPEQFTSLKNEVKNQVLKVGTNGSDTEEGICASLHFLYDQSPSSFFKKGNKGAIVFLTDENDASLFETCSKQITFKSSAQPVVYYGYEQERVQFSLVYEIFNDNVPKNLTTLLSLPFRSVVHKTTSSLDGVTCAAADQEELKNNLKKQGYNLISLSDCIYTKKETHFLGADFGDTGTNPNLNLCNSSFVFNGYTYPNIYSYINALKLVAIPQSCKKTIAESNSFQQTAERISVIPKNQSATQYEDLLTGFIDQAENQFGNGYLVASLIRIQNETCELKPGQSIGTLFQALSAKVPENSIVESLCASSFSNVMGKVSSFMVDQARRSYSLTVLSDDEMIKGINIKRGSNEFSLSSHQYEVVGSTFTFTNFDVQKNDVIRVLVSKQSP